MPPPPGPRTCGFSARSASSVTWVNSLSTFHRETELITPISCNGACVKSLTRRSARAVCQLLLLLPSLCPRPTSTCQAFQPSPSIATAASLCPIKAATLSPHNSDISPLCPPRSTLVAESTNHQSWDQLPPTSRPAVSLAAPSNWLPDWEESSRKEAATASLTAAIGRFSRPALLPTPALSTQLPTLAIPATPLTGPSPHARPRLKASRASSHLIFLTST